MTRFVGRHTFASGNLSIAVLALLFVSGVTSAMAQEEAISDQAPSSETASLNVNPELLTGEEIVAKIAGNTLKGVSNRGLPWMEYYATNGAILGKTGAGMAATRYGGTWQVTGNVFCVDYIGAINDNCWQILRSPEHIVLRELEMEKNTSMPTRLIAGKAEGL